MALKETKGYHNLIVWQRARQLVKEIYEFTKNLPKDETFGLISQLRRAAVSVVANLVEGYSRGYKSTKEAKQFFSISAGSLTEIEALLEITLDVYPRLISQTEYQKLELLRGEVAYLLSRFINSFNRFNNLNNFKKPKE